MNDSADMKSAAQSLQLALTKLEGALDPLMRNVHQLKAEATESEGFSQDRARLASELDNAKAEAEDLQKKMVAREKEFASLAEESTQELNSVIKTVQIAMEGLPS